MSAEASCCVAAMSLAKPGDYFDENGHRMNLACPSGTDGCMWGGDIHKLPWEKFQEDLARNITGKDVPDVYLNAGLVGGTVRNLLNLISFANMAESEDDQAVFTDLMYRRPDMIVLDYAQEMFGNNRWWLGMAGDGCVYRKTHTGQLAHIETGTTPFALHTAGKFFKCFSWMANQLELDRERTSTERSLRGSLSRELKPHTLTTRGGNYGPIPCLGGEDDPRFEGSKSKGKSGKSKSGGKSKGKSGFSKFFGKGKGSKSKSGDDDDSTSESPAPTYECIPICDSDGGGSSKGKDGKGKSGSKSQGKDSKDKTRAGKNKKRELGGISKGKSKSGDDDDSAPTDDCIEISGKSKGKSGKSKGKSGGKYKKIRNKNRELLDEAENANETASIFDDYESQTRSRTRARRTTTSSGLPLLFRSSTAAL
jgi:hypothetical protein